MPECDQWVAVGIGARARVRVTLEILARGPIQGGDTALSDHAVQAAVRNRRGAHLDVAFTGARAQHCRQCGEGREAVH